MKGEIVSVSLDEAMDRAIERHMDRFVVDDDQKAIWAMRKLRAIKQKKADNQRVADEEIQRVHDWLAEANGSYDRDEQYFTGLLIEYARKEREQNDRKSIKLPHGTVASRKGGDKITVTDADAFIKWARENGREDLVRVKEEPALSLIKQAFPPKDSPMATHDGYVITEDGEIVLGLHASPAEITYAVEVEL